MLTRDVGVSAIAAGGWHSLAIKPDGSLWAWGRNNHGQLGTGDLVDRDLPEIVFLSGVSAVVAGQLHSMIILHGSLYGWGNNAHGQLATGDTTEIHFPMKILDSTVAAIGDDTVVAVSCQEHCMAILDSGGLVVWGSNQYGQLGSGDKVDLLTPLKLFDTGVSAVSAGYRHSLAIMADGSMKAWGDNTYGQLGNDGEQSELYPVNADVPPYAVRQTAGAVLEVAAGEFHSLARTADGRYWAWGRNEFGQLGIESCCSKKYVPTESLRENSSPKPATSASLTRVTSLAMAVILCLVEF